jgi:hypothetical protein
MGFIILPWVLHAANDGQPTVIRVSMVVLLIWWVPLSTIVQQMVVNLQLSE